jgi:hypothetical protein
VSLRPASRYRYNPRVPQTSSTATLIPRFHLALPARLAILGALFFAEKVLLSAFVDFDRAQAAQGFGAIVRGAQHWGFRFLVALATATTVFAYVRGGQKLISTMASARRPRYVLVGCWRTSCSSLRWCR